VSARPPRWAYRLLRASLPPGSAGESILGDLHEEYARRPAGARRDLRYVASALLLALGYRLQRRRGGAAWDGLALDLRQAARGLLRRPGYLLTAVLTLAVGIGATTAAFSIIYGALLRPLPYREPDRLLRVYGWRKQFSTDSFNSMSPLNFRDLRARARGFDGLAGYQHRYFNLSGRAGDDDPLPVRVSGLRAEAALLEVLGVPPQAGRLLTDEDEKQGAAPVAVIGDELWRSRFGADPAIVGRKIRLDLVEHTVVGVLPPSFSFLRNPQIIVPMDLDGPEFSLRLRRSIDGVGRLAPGVSADAGIAELQAIFADLEEEYPEANEGWSVTGVAEREWRVRRWRSQLWLFGGAVALVLLIACGNVSGLMLVRAEGRGHELGVRAALGAGRARLARLFALESLLVSLAGGVLGALLCRWLVSLAVAAYASSIPRVEEIGVDSRAVTFAMIVALLSGLLVALAPVLQLPDKTPYGALRRNDRTASGRTTTLRRALVIGQVALAVVLVTGAGLMIDTVRRLRAIDLGVDDAQVLTFGIGLPAARYASPVSQSAFWDRFVAEIEAIPAVQAAGLSSRLPLNGGTNGTLVLGGEPDIEPTAETLVEIRSVSPGYFAAAGIGLLRGRMLTTSDRDPGGGVLVNEAFVRRRLDGRDPLRERLRPTWLTEEYPIVGVVSDAREFGPLEEARPTAYWMVGTESLGMTTAYEYVALRTVGPPRAVLPQVLERLGALDADIPVVDVQTLDEISANSIGGNRRSALSLLSIFAGVALLLGAIGIYGVVSFGVRTRERELGVRMALGASRHSVVGLVLSDGVRMAFVGVVLGLLAALLAGRLLAGLLYQVSPTEPAVLLAVAGVLLATAVLASWLPALRAARVPVVEALRGD
jgi:predicted permease